MKKVEFDYHHEHHYKKQTKSKKTLWISLILTLFFALIELLGGIFSNSLALISDSFHMFSDVLALVLSMIALFFAAKKPTKKLTFGYLRLEIIAAFLNGLALIVIALGIIYEAILRMIHPEPIDFFAMISIAIIGLIVNLVLTFVLMQSLKEEENLNIKSALWHFLGDLLNSVGVIIAAILVRLTGYTIIDAIISFVISVVILMGGYKIIKKAYFILMEAVPEHLDIEVIRNDIKQIEGVSDIHEFHLWSISEGLYSLTFHVMLDEYDHYNNYQIIQNITKMLQSKYHIEHVTIQIEDPSINVHHD